VALKRIVFGAAALSGARMFQLASSFLTVPILTRILAPEDYGLVALALAIVSLTLYLGDAGLGRSLMRTSAGDEIAWSSAHWLVVAFTGSLALLLVLCAWPASLFFNEPRLTMVLIALALVPVGFGINEIPGQALLQREQIAWLAAAEFFSALVGAGLAIAMAMAGAGVWALVVQNVSIQVAKACVILPASRFRPKLVLSFAALQQHARFAFDTIGFAITNFVSRQTDPLVIGKVLGTGPLGFYSIAYRIMSMPANIVGVPLQGALYPRLAKLKDDLPALKQVVLAATMMQAALVFPPMAAMAVASHSVFTLLLSQRWAPTAAIFTALAVAGLAQTVTTLNGPVLQAVGRTGARLRLTVEFAILWAVSVLVLVRFGANAVAWGFSVATMAYMPRLLLQYLKPIDCTLIEYCNAIAGPTLVALGIVAAHLAVRSAVHMGPWMEVGLAGLETLAGWGVYVLVSRRGMEGRLRLVGDILRT
jgi:O-antigen/teichoic acid export membrane protein